MNPIRMRHGSLLATSLLLLLACHSSDLYGQRNQPSDTQDRRAEPNIDARITQWLAGDADKDGKLARSETDGRLKQSFNFVDQNKDGFLQRSELKSLAQRLGRNAARPRPNQQEVSDEALRKMTPEGVTVLPNLAYREPSDVPGSRRWRLDLAMPAQQSDQPRPAIVFVHGGGWRSGDKRRPAFLGPALEYAADGYVTMTVNYRLRDHGPISNCVADVKCAVRWLRAHADKYNVDPDRIGAYGNSAGAHLVSMLGLCPKSADMEGDGPWQEHSSMVQAVCASATPTSFLIPMNNRSPRPNDSAPAGDRNAGRGAEMSEQARAKISPMTYVSADAPPFLLVHEASDRTVAVQQSDKFVEALKKAGASDITYMRYDDGTGHGTFMANQTETKPAMKRFFDRVLRDES